MTMHYSEAEERHLREKAEKREGLNALELFMCSDGNYRDAESKARFDKMREDIRRRYLP